MKIERLVIANPTGNVTGIVFDVVDKQHYAAIGAAIQNEYPSIEQVVYVIKNGVNYHGQMAGGEFCGNAARALGYVLANGQNTNVSFTMSGLSSPVTVGVHPHRSKLIMTTNFRKEVALLEESEIPIVHMEGISHAILLPTHPLYQPLKEYAARLDGKDAVKEIMGKLDLIKLSACGVLFVDTRQSTIDLTPYVYVRDAETLYAETACASGSVAIASLIGSDIIVRQPSKKNLRVHISNLNEKVMTAAVDGSMDIMWDGVADDLHPVFVPPTTKRLSRAALAKYDAA